MKDLSPMQYCDKDIHFIIVLLGVVITKNLTLSNLSTKLQHRSWQVQMFDSVCGVFNIVTLERLAPVGNIVFCCIYQ